MAAARGESDLILIVRDCDRAGDVCIRMCWRREPDVRASASGMVEPRIGDKYREGCR